MLQLLQSDCQGRSFEAPNKYGGTRVEYVCTVLTLGITLVFYLGFGSPSVQPAKLNAD